MTDSIFDSVKKVLGIPPDETEFDIDILMHINSVFGTLNQLGVGPDEGFDIEDNVATWNDFTGGDKRLNGVKTYVSQKVGLIFDRPQTSYAIASIEKNLAELEWRLQIVKENDRFLAGATDLVTTFPPGSVLDGGSP